MSEDKPNVTPPDDDNQGPPAWIVSFSDMVTLLLAFFVMLQSFAVEQQPKMFYEGQATFRRAINWINVRDTLFGQDDPVEFGHRQKRHPMKEDPQAEPERIIDAEDRKIRNAFQQLREMMQVKADDVPNETTIQPFDLDFSDDGQVLAEDGRRRLEEFMDELTGARPGQPIRLRVVGLTGDQGSEQNQWAVSARRARAAEEAIRNYAANKGLGELQDISSWGRGTGGQWSKRRGIDPSTANIVLIVMEAT
ncbi:MAG: flagellar motor protein MotB [Phycisphaerae bacterium]